MKKSFAERYKAIYDKMLARWQYASEGVWADHRDTLKVNVLKTINLTVRTFMSSDLQNKAGALTYQTLLALVPILALLFAIGRGFGFGNMLQDELLRYFPSQHKALEMAFKFVDSTLAQASEGIFVGVGIVFLLWTIISLLSNVEEMFNQVWNVKVDRSMTRKLVDYLAICIILPVLMICSGGIQIFMSSAIQRFLPYDFLSPVLSLLFDFMSVVFAWLFFAGAYMLIPNAKVKFSNAIIAGVLAGTAFQLLQWVFLSGQMYVSKYNAIYGSFSFLPLLLIWMQFSWLICLAGALVCHAAQNISMYSYSRHVRDISPAYAREVCVAVLSVILKRFRDEQRPINSSQLSELYKIPWRLSVESVDRLIRCGLLIRVMPTPEMKETDGQAAVQPAMSLEHYTLAEVISRFETTGEDDFVDSFPSAFPKVVAEMERVRAAVQSAASSTLVQDL
ncbi:MAG: YihY/virulence factor BrkB family protein [Duncaniella sp.]|nr:YihY/virulence factor BrkB family protein [Duncaniella sp.]